MIPEIPPLLLILKEACEKHGYSWKLADTYSNNLAEVSDGNKSFFSSNAKVGTYPTNPQFASQIAKDKAWCYKVLKKRGYKIPKGEYFFLREEYREMRGDKKELSDAFKFARKIGYPVFVKPNSNSLGILAEVIENEEELKKHLKAIAEISWIALIQEVIEQPEYRIFAVNGGVEFTYQRKHAKIMGDGKSSIKELVDQLNQKVKRERNKMTQDSPFIKKQLQTYQLSWESILEENQELRVAPKSNLASGGEVEDYREKVSEKTQIWVKELMNNLCLKVCGIDIFVKNSINNPEDFTVIEVNASPSLSGIYEMGKREKAMKIWGKVMSEYFK